MMIPVLVMLTMASYSQDTFSIVAVDTITGEIGSAGASCIDETAIAGGALIISDVLPGRGAIHTQSYWNATNQANAHNRMVEGLSPQEIIDWLVDNDVANNPGVRQYGIVDFDTQGHPRSAGFTGANCMNYKNHITGPNYSIQGNILLGQAILDSMEARFLHTEGSFAEKLMAALQGANVVGADTRCTDNRTSSLSAFIRVARPDNTQGNFYCDLNVPSIPEGMEPIDSLQTLFDAWLGTTVGVEEDDFATLGLDVFPNPAGNYLMVTFNQNKKTPFAIQETPTNASENLIISLFTLDGRRVFHATNAGGKAWSQRIDTSKFPEGLYILRIYGSDLGSAEKRIIIH